MYYEQQSIVVAVLNVSFDRTRNKSTPDTRKMQQQAPVTNKECDIYWVLNVDQDREFYDIFSCPKKGNKSLAFFGGQLA
jgi:hypothetical protein